MSILAGGIFLSGNHSMKGGLIASLTLPQREFVQTERAIGPWVLHNDYGGVYSIKNYTLQAQNVTDGELVVPDLPVSPSHIGYYVELLEDNVPVHVLYLPKGLNSTGVLHGVNSNALLEMHITYDGTFEGIIIYPIQYWDHSDMSDPEAKVSVYLAEN